MATHGIENAEMVEQIKAKQTENNNNKTKTKQNIAKQNKKQSYMTSPLLPHSLNFKNEYRWRIQLYIFGILMTS